MIIYVNDYITNLKYNNCIMIWATDVTGAAHPMRTVPPAARPTMKGAGVFILNSITA